MKLASWAYAGAVLLFVLALSIEFMPYSATGMECGRIGFPIYDAVGPHFTPQTAADYKALACREARPDYAFVSRMVLCAGVIASCFLLMRAWGRRPSRKTD